MRHEFGTRELSDLCVRHSLRGRLDFDVGMAKKTSLKVGGAARGSFTPLNCPDLSDFLSASEQFNLPLMFVGLGSNLLVRDEGLSGITVFTHKALSELELQLDGQDSVIYAEAGVAAPKLARFSALHHFEGAEFLAGIPGTVGGALAMNAGCYGSETWDHVLKVKTIDKFGNLKIREKSEFFISYREVTSKYDQSEFFVGGWFRFRRGSGDRSREKIKNLLARRVSEQPLDKPNCGSVFRNPPGYYAAQLIENCDLKGKTIGGAMISPKHANFIVNTGGASAREVELLIREVQSVVAERMGVDLHPEVKILGAKSSG